MMKKYFLLSIIVMILLSCWGWLCSSPVHAQQIDRNTKNQLQGYLRDKQINGIVLVNGKGKQPLVLRNNITSNRKQIVREKELFPIGSLQKLITGVAIYQLVEKNKLNWNTALSYYFPKINGAQQITIQELMTHTSGLQNDGALPEKSLRNEKAQESFFLQHFRVTNNHSWNYQDIDFEFLAAIIRKQTHNSYYHYVSKNIFNPLKLHEFKMVNSVKKTTALQTMMAGVSWPVLTQTSSAEIGAGDLWVSPLDYWDFIYNGVLKDKQLIKTFVTQPKSQRENYFGGVYLQGSVIRANGSEPGYNCCFFADYKSKRTLMFFANNIDYKTLRQTADDLYQIYYGEHIQP